jgi:hypothetical protein
MAKRGTLSAARAMGVKMRRASKNVAPSAKALYHAETGAGRSRVIRNFFGLSADDERALVGLVQQHLRTLTR